MCTPASPARTKVVSVGVGEAGEPEADCEVDPHAITPREKAAATRTVGRCNRRALDSMSIPPPPLIWRLAPALFRYNAREAQVPWRHLRLRCGSHHAGVTRARARTQASAARARRAAPTRRTRMPR